MITRFGNDSYWRVLTGGSNPAYTAYPDGPAGWNISAGYNDAGWAIKQNGCASGAPTGAPPDVTQSRMGTALTEVPWGTNHTTENVSPTWALPGIRSFVSSNSYTYDNRWTYGSHDIYHNSSIAADCVNYARGIFTLDAADIAAGILLNWGVRYSGRLWINGVLQGDLTSSGLKSMGQYNRNISAHCTVGANLIAIQQNDWYGAGPSSGGVELGDEGPAEGEPREALLWARIETKRSAPLIIPETGKYRIYHQYGNYSSGTTAGVAIVSPFYELLQTSVANPRGGGSYIREFQAGDEVVFRAIRGGADDFNEEWNSTWIHAHTQQSPAAYRDTDYFHYSDGNASRNPAHSKYVGWVGWGDLLRQYTPTYTHDAYTSIMHDWESWNEAMVVGGPLGDWRWSAESNEPLGLIAPGWHRGQRSGVADGKWIHNYPFISQRDPVPEEERNIEFMLAAGSQITTSVDGVIWSDPVSVGSGPINDLIYVSYGDQWMALSGNEVFISADRGLTWESRGTPAGAAQLHGGVWSDPSNDYVMVGGAGAAVYKSWNGGVNWIQHTSGSDQTVPYPYPEVPVTGTVTSFWKQVDYDTVYFTTDTGELWRVSSSQYLARFHVEDVALYDVDYSVELDVEVAVGAQGRIICRSMDYALDEDFTAQVSGTTEDLTTVIWVSDLNLFFVSGENGTLLKSEDGRSWTQVEVGMASAAVGVSWSNQAKQLIAAGDGVVKTSTNGTTWETRSVPTSEDVTAVIGRQFVDDYDEARWIPADCAYIETFDDRYALGLYWDVNYGDDSDPIYTYLRGVLFERIGDALHTVSNHVLDIGAYIADDNWFERQSLHLARLSDTEMVLSFDRGMKWNPGGTGGAINDFDMGMPAVAVLRKVGDRIETVAQKMLIEDYAIAEWYWSPDWWRGTVNVAPLTRTKWAVLHEKPATQAEVEASGFDKYFLANTDDYRDVYGDMDVLLFVTICEWDGGVGITVGDSVLVAETWSESFLTAVGEDLAVLTQGHEGRYHLREKFLVGEHVGIPYYNGSLFVQCISVDGLTATAHPDGGWTDTLAGDMYGTQVRAVPVNGGTRVVVNSIRVAAAQDALLLPQNAPLVEGVAVPPSTLHDLLWRPGNAYGSTSIYDASEVPALWLLTINDDFSLTADNRVAHVLDGSGVTRWTTPTAVGDSNYSNRSGLNGSMHLTETRDPNAVLASWSLFNANFDDNLEGIEKAAVVRFDPTSASGLSQAGFRTLKIDAPFTYQDPIHRAGFLRPFVGTDYYTAWVGEYLAFYENAGDLANMEDEFPDLPGDFWDYEDDYPYSGIYRYNSNVVAWNEWEDANIPLYRNRFDNEPWDMTLQEMMDAGGPHVPEQYRAYTGPEVYADDVLKFCIWEIPLDPGQAHSSGTTERVLRPGD